MPGNTTKQEETARRLVESSMTPQEQEIYLAKCIEEEREVVRDRLRQIKKGELREQAQEQVRKEVNEGNIPPKPPQPWKEYIQENAEMAFNKVHNFAVVYITAENATYGVGTLAMVSMAATKKGVAVAAATNATVTAAIVANPVVATVGAACLVGYGVYKFKHRNDPPLQNDNDGVPMKSWRTINQFMHGATKGPLYGA